MTPDEIRAWIDSHQGPGVGSTGPDDQGIMVTVAADGSRLTTRRLGPDQFEVLGREENGPAAGAAPSTGAPAGTPAPAAAPGPISTLSQDQVGARLQEIGQSVGGVRYVPQQKMRTVPNPASVPGNPAYQYGAPPTIQQPYTVETWYDTRTNTPIFAGERQPDGSFNVTLDTTPRQPAGAANYGPPGGKEFIDDGPEVGAAGRRWGWDQSANGGRGGYTRDLGPSPAAQKPTTGTKREPDPDHPGYTKVTTTDTSTNQSETHYEDANGNKFTSLPNPQKPVQAADGSWGYWDTSVPGAAPTWKPIANGPAAEQKPVQVNGQWGVWKPGTNGAAPTFQTVAVPNVKLPDGAPQIDTSSGRAAHASFSALATWVQGKYTSGGLTYEQANQILNMAKPVAQLAIDQENEDVRRQESARAAAQTERGQDITQSDARLTSANNQFARADADATAVGALAPAGSGRDTLLGSLLLQGVQARLSGGMNTPASAIDPSRARILALGQPPGGPPGPPGPPPVPPASAPALTPPGVQQQQNASAAAEAQRQAAVAPGAAVPAQGAARPASTGPAAPVVAAGPSANAYPHTAATDTRIPSATSPDDILTLAKPDGTNVYITRANWDLSPPAAQAAYTVVNAESGDAFRAHTQTSQAAPDQPYTGDGSTPSPAPSLPRTNYGDPGMTVRSGGVAPDPYSGAPSDAQPGTDYRIPIGGAAPVPMAAYNAVSPGGNVHDTVAQDLLGFGWHPDLVQQIRNEYSGGA